MVGISEQEMRVILDGATRRQLDDSEPEALRQTFIDAVVKVMVRNNAAIAAHLKSRDKQRLVFASDERDWD